MCMCVCVCRGINGGESPEEKDKVEGKKMSSLYHFTPVLTGPLKGTEMEILALAHQKKI